jgi:hypothetical protein
MTPLILSEEQKLKLLKMCKVLFSEYDKTYSEQDFEKLPRNSYSTYKPQKPEWSVGDDGVVYLQLYYILYEDMTYELVEIHWFQLCWEILAKLMKSKTPLQVTREIQLFGLIYFNKQNPVDYLYNIFKEQNK